MYAILLLAASLGQVEAKPHVMLFCPKIRTAEDDQSFQKLESVVDQVERSAAHIHKFTDHHPQYGKWTSYHKGRPSLIISDQAGYVLTSIKAKDVSPDDSVESLLESLSERSVGWFRRGCFFKKCPPSYPRYPAVVPVQPQPDNRVPSPTPVIDPFQEQIDALEAEESVLGYVIAGVILGVVISIFTVLKDV